jgi:hypothetical protein
LVNEAARLRSIGVLLPPATTATFDPAGAGWQGLGQDGGQSPRASLVDAAFAALVRETPPDPPAALLGSASLGDTVLTPAADAGVAVAMARLWEGDMYAWFGRTNSAS